MIKKQESKTAHAKVSTTEKVEVKKGRYTEGIGRRKTAIARVRLTKGTGTAMVNDKKVGEYFSVPRLKEVALAPLHDLKLLGDYDMHVHVYGGGVHAQAEAVRHGIARALVMINEEFKHRLHTLGFLTRDSRMVERKKYGLKKARRAPQWKKR